MIFRRKRVSNSSFRSIKRDVMYNAGDWGREHKKTAPDARHVRGNPKAQQGTALRRQWGMGRAHPARRARGNPFLRG